MFYSDGVSRDDKVDPAVLGSALCGRVVRYRFGLAVTSGGDVIRLYSLCDQKVANGVGAIFREFLVVCIATDAVGIALDLNL